MSDKLYIVTGAMGHLGNVIIGKLIRRGEEVRGLALPGDDSVHFQDRINLIRGNVTEPESMEPLFADTAGRDVVVIHTAGIVSIASKFDQRVHDVNVGGTRNVVNLCEKHEVRKLVHVSSVHAIPIPEDGGLIREVSHFSPESVSGLYAQTKAEATQYVLDRAVATGLDASVVHPSGILGPGDHGRGHLTQMVADYLNGTLTACVRGGYDFVDVRDVANGILSCVEKGKPGECYILSGRYSSVQDMLHILHELSGRKDIRTVLPLWFARFTAPLSEIYYKIRRQPPLYTAYSMETLTADADFSHEKATRELGYTVRPFRETLADSMEWLRRIGRVK